MASKELNILSLEEAITLANLLDRAGEVKSADAVDEYIVKMAQTNDIIKQAGLFKNLMRKLFGYGKTVFFKVYRDLYNEAKKSMKQLDEKIGQINKEYKDIKSDFKHHDLEGWRGRVHNLNLTDGPEIMRNFDQAYGKLVQYLGISGKEVKKDEEKDVSQIGKLPDLTPQTENIKSPEYWGRQTPGAEEGWSEIARSIAFNPSSGGLRFDKKYFNYLLGKHISTDGTGNVKYWSSYDEKQQPLQGRLKDLMGTGIWNAKEHGDYIMLFPENRGSDVGSPVVNKVYPEEDVFEDPKLPMPGPAEESVLMSPYEDLEGKTKTPKEKEEKQENTEVLKKTKTPAESVTKPKGPVVPPEIAGEKSSPKDKRIWMELSEADFRKGDKVKVYSYVLPAVAKKYSRLGKGQDVSSSMGDFLNTALNKDFDYHKAGGKRVFLPYDDDKRQKRIEELKAEWK